jgi:hypothetical protein
MVTRDLEITFKTNTVNKNVLINSMQGKPGFAGDSASNNVCRKHNSRMQMP